MFTCKGQTGREQSWPERPGRALPVSTGSRCSVSSSCRWEVCFMGRGAVTPARRKEYKCSRLGPVGALIGEAVECRQRPGPATRQMPHLPAGSCVPLLHGPVSTVSSQSLQDHGPELKTHKHIHTRKGFSCTNGRCQEEGAGKVRITHASLQGMGLMDCF